MPNLQFSTQPTKFILHLSFLQLKRSDLHQDVLQILGETINLQDLNNTLSSLPLKEALLAYLRPSVMLDLSKGVGYDV